VIGRLLGTITLAAVAAGALGTVASAGQGRAAGPRRQGDGSIATLPDWSGAWVIPFSEFRKENLQQRNPNAGAPMLTPRFAEMQAAYPFQRRSNAEACLPTGMPNVMRYPFAVEFLFTPGRVTILLEQDSMVRRVYTDGRPHTVDPDPTYTGESIGHWEGQTLVVDTTAISSSAELQAGVPTSGKAHVVERIHLVDARHLQIDTIVEDAEALKAPWRRSRIYERSDAGFFERICLDNNRDVNGGEPNLTPPK